MKKRGFTQLQNSVIFDKEMSDGDFRIYAALKSYKHGKSGKSYPSQKFLADQLNKGERTVRRHIRSLKNAKKLIVISRGRKSSNIYNFSDERTDKNDLLHRSTFTYNTGEKWPSNNTKVNNNKFNKTRTNFRFNDPQSFGVIAKRRYPEL